MARMASEDAQEYWHLAASVARRSAEADPKALFPTAETVAIRRPPAGSSPRSTG